MVKTAVTRIAWIALFVLAGPAAAVAQDRWVDACAENVGSFLRDKFAASQAGRLDLLDPERKESRTVELTRKRFLTVKDQNPKKQ